MKTLEEKLRSLPANRQQSIHAESTRIISEELTLRELRKSLGITQAQMAEMLGKNQENISRFENRPDVLVSKLREFVEALGGELEISVKTKEDKLVKLTSLVNS